MNSCAFSLSPISSSALCAFSVARCRNFHFIEEETEAAELSILPESPAPSMLVGICTQTDLKARLLCVLPEEADLDERADCQALGAGYSRLSSPVLWL